MLSFQEWVIQEAATADMRTDIGRGYKFNIGDWLYFGIHELAREVKANKKLPLWQPQDLIHAMRPVVDISPTGAPDGGELVWVKSDKTPSQLGYRKITGRNGAKVKEVKDGYLIGIPAEWVEDVTQVFGTGGQLSGSKLGLPYDRGIPSQTRLINMIRRIRDHKEDPQGAGAEPISRNEIDAARASLGAPNMETQPTGSGPTSFDALFNTPDAEEPKAAPLAGFRAKPQQQGLDALLGGRGVGGQSGEPKNIPLAGFRRQRQPQQRPPDLNTLLGGRPSVIPMRQDQRQTANYDPNINPYWKDNSDNRQYQYFAG